MNHKLLNEHGAVDAMFVVLALVLIAFAGFVAWRLNVVDEHVTDTTDYTIETAEDITGDADQQYQALQQAKDAKKTE